MSSSAPKTSSGSGSPTREPRASHKARDEIDWRVFLPSVLVIAGLIIPIILFPESGEAAVNAAFAFATGNFGWLYLLAGFSVVVFLIGLAFSRYGNVRLGGPQDTRNSRISAGSR